jgi:fructokinase
MSFKIIGIGEVLWDLLPTGPQIGGAPANFACHARALGGDAGVISRIGADPLGNAIIERFDELGISTRTIQLDEDASTGTVSVALQENGTPTYIIRENVAWDRLAASTQGLKAVGEANAVCFGSLAQRSAASRDAIQKLVASAPPDSLRVFDINLRQHYYSRDLIEQSLRIANVLKLNDSELTILAELFNLRGTIRQQIESVAERYDLQLLALTRGPEGSLLFQAGQWSECTARPVQIVDTVGAGDAFTAALVMGLLRKMELDEIGSIADEVARYVCSCAGATPPLPKKFADKFAAYPASFKTASK